MSHGDSALPITGSFVDKVVRTQQMVKTQQVFFKRQQMVRLQLQQVPKVPQFFRFSGPQFQVSRVQQVLKVQQMVRIKQRAGIQVVRAQQMVKTQQVFKR